MRDEYDFRGGQRGKHVARFAEGSNLVLLDDDVAEIFRDSESVNRALRPISEMIRRRLAKTADPEDSALLRERGPDYVKK